MDHGGDNGIIDLGNNGGEVNIGIAQRIHSTLVKHRTRCRGVAKTLRIQHRKHLDGEIRREDPGDGVMKRSTFSSGAVGGTKEEGTELVSAIDENRLFGVGRGRLEEAVEGKVEGNWRRGIGEGKQKVKEMVHLREVRRKPRVLRGRRARAFGHGTCWWRVEEGIHSGWW